MKSQPLNRRRGALFYSLETQWVTRTLCSASSELPSDYCSLGSADSERPLNSPRNNCIGQLGIDPHIFGLPSALLQSRYDKPSRVLRAHRSCILRGATFLGGAQNKLAPLCGSSPDNILTYRGVQGSSNPFRSLDLVRRVKTNKGLWTYSSVILSAIRPHINVSEHMSIR